MCIKTQLRDWCLFQNFDLYIDRRDFHVPSVLGADGIHLSQSGKCTFACKLAGLINGTSNYNLWGKLIISGEIKISLSLVWHHLRVTVLVGAFILIQGTPKTKSYTEAYNMRIKQIGLEVLVC